MFTKVRLFVVLVLLAVPPAAAVDVITTVAGNGINSDTGDGIAATAASILDISEGGVGVDSSGNIYFADQITSRVRKIDTATGLISTIAGNGVAGFSGDNGPAVSASVSVPSGVIVDSSGNVFFCDSGNHRIRKISAGIITTVAGDGFLGECDFGRYNGDGISALSASLSEPRFVAVDGSGNIFIGDAGNNRIRRVDAGTGLISTVAGNGLSGFSGDGGPATAATFNEINGMTADSAGNIFIAEGDRIRKVTVIDGNINTIAGDGTTGYSGDNGPALASRLDNPSGLAIDPPGNLFICDKGNNRVRKIDAAGTITTIAGNGLDGFSGDGGPALSATLAEPTDVTFDAAGNLYITDDGNIRIRKLTAATGNLSTIAGNGSGAFAGDGGPAVQASLKIPLGVAADAAGNVYIADNENHRVRKIDPAGVMTTLAGTGVGGLSGDGGPAASAQLHFPNAVAVDAAGNVYIADADNAVIRKVSATTGIISTVAGNGNQGYSGDNGPAVNAELGEIHSLAVDAAGNLYLGDKDNNVVRKVDAAGIITTVAGMGMNGFSGDNGPALAAMLCEFKAMAINNIDGSLIIADTFNYRIRRVDSAGTITTIAGTGARGFSGDNGPAIAAQVGRVTGLAVDAAGNLFIADSSNNRIRKLDTGGIITTVAGTGAFSYSGDGGNALAATLAYPTGLASGPAGIFIADSANNRIRRLRANLPPVLAGVTASQDPVKTNTPVTFTADATDANGDTLTYTWTTTDGQAGSGNPLTIAFGIEGSFTGTVTVSDGFESVFGSGLITVVAPPSAAIGVKNISEDNPPVVNPLNGIAVNVASSEGGIVELSIDVDALNRAAFSVGTDFLDIPGRSATGVKGTRPVHRFTRTGVFVATSTATDISTGQARGKARKTLVISRKETGQEAVVASDPASREVATRSMKGKFLFTKTTPDQVSYSGTIKLPAGLDMSKVQEFAVGLGNVTDSTTVDPKGKGTLPGIEGRIKKLKVKYPRLKGTTVTAGGEDARVDLTLSTADMEVAGFDTEGVSPLAIDLDAKGAASRSIQVGMMLAGVSYETLAPVQFKLSKKKDSGQLIQGRAGN